MGQEIRDRKGGMGIHLVVVGLAGRSKSSPILLRRFDPLIAIAG